MSKLFRAFVVSLQVFSLAASCAAQGAALPPKDEEPLAAALRLARGLELPLGKEDTLVRLVNAHQAAGRFEEAVRAAGAMDDGGMKAIVLCRIANRLAEAGKFERAAELLSEVLQTVRRTDDEGFTSDLLHEIIVGEVQHDFDSFPSRSETRKGALARLFEAGRAEAAAEIVSRVSEALLDPDRDNLHAARLLARLARLYGASDASKSAGLLSEALGAARREDDDRDRIGALCEVARAHADAGDRKAAESLLDEAQQSAAALGDDREGELRHVASAYAAMGLTAKALKVSQEAGGVEWYNSSPAVEAAAAAGRPEALKESLTRALARVALLEFENGKSDALSQLAGLYGPHAPELLADVQWAARSLRDDYERATALAAIGDRYAEAGRKELALEAWGHAYEAARAIKLRKSDYEASSSIRTDRTKIRLLGALGSRLIRAGEHARTPEVARDMRAVRTGVVALIGGETASVHGADSALAGQADELTRAGLKEAALAVLAQAVGPDEKLDEDASPVVYADALAALGAAYARAGDRRRAAAYFGQALRLAAENKEFNEEDKLRVLIEVGARYAEAGIEADARVRGSLRRIVRGVEADRE